MLERIQSFARLLRQNRVRVSTGEVLDAVAAVEAVGLARVDDVRLALAATLIKRSVDEHVFVELFELYFLSAGEAARQLGSPLAGALRQAGLGDDEIAALLAELAARVAELGAAARLAAGLAALDGRAILAAASAATAGVRLSSPLQVGYYSQRALAELDFAGAERELQAVADSLARGRVLAPIFTANLAALRAAVRQQVQAIFEQQNVDFAASFRARSLAEKPFTQLGEDDIARLRVEVQRLARKLRSQAVVKPSRRRGRLDVRRTMRKAMATGGIPIALRYRRKKVHKPRLVVLCDISDSVKNVARFMLELVYLLGERFERVRSFVFVAQLGETTELFRRMDIDQAVRTAYEGGVVSVSAGSDYGRAFGEMAARHADAIGSRTTLLVIGDGRCNYQPPNLAALAELRSRAHRLVWLTPEPPPAWGFGDSAMRTYEPLCDQIVVAQNLASLRQVVDDLSLS